MNNVIELSRREASWEYAGSMYNLQGLLQPGR
jgi:hypothetical protein